MRPRTGLDELIQTPIAGKVALAGLASVLLFLSGFAIWAVRTTRGAAEGAARSSRLSDSYDHARFAVAEERSLEREYRLKPYVGTRRLFDQTSASFLQSLGTISRIGDRSDRDLVRRMSLEHTTYLKAIDRLFTAVDEGRTKLAERIDREEIDSVFSDIEERVYTASFQHQSEASDRFRSLEQTEEQVFAGTTVAFTAGLVLLATFSVILLGHKRLLRKGEERFRAALEKANQDLADAQELSHIGSWEWDVTADTVWWSDEMYRICGFKAGGFEPSYDSFLQLVHEDDRHMVVGNVQNVRAGQKRIDHECRIVRPNGAVRVIQVIGEATFVDGAFVRLLGTCQDVTERKLLEEEVEYKAFHDSLTGLANRALFLNRLDHALALRERSGIPLSVLFADLDDFKTINDSLGHAAGDELLCGFARRVEAVLRPSDTVARLGGDEFAVLLESTDAAGAERVADRIKEALQVPISLLESRDVTARTSIGIAVASDGISPDELVRDADIAMYEAKNNGSNSHAVFVPEMRASIVKSLALKAELRHAVERDEFVLHYQPILDLDSGETVGLEALVRWNHPERGLLPPGDFIPLAEETGLIVPLGTWVLREATSRTKLLQELMKRELWVSVNLSVGQLHERDLVGIVARTLFESGLEPHNLTLEITESSLMEDNDGTTLMLRELRALGVRIAIDDFGTGYSSLSYLHNFPVDVLKIDRAFVAGVTGDPEEAALARAVIKFASVLKLDTIAEGIETDEQLNTLRKFGCRWGQGYLFSRPVEPSEIEGKLLGAPL